MYRFYSEAVHFISIWIYFVIWVGEGCYKLNISSTLKYLGKTKYTTETQKTSFATKCRQINSSLKFKFWWHWIFKRTITIFVIFLLLKNINDHFKHIKLIYTYTMKFAKYLKLFKPWNLSHSWWAVLTLN